VFVVVTAAAAAAAAAAVDDDDDDEDFVIDSVWKLLDISPYKSYSST
jgi:hypothetical protein